MTTSPRATTIIQALDTALATTMGLERTNTVRELVAPLRASRNTGPVSASGTPGPARYLREPFLRLANHFDLHPAFLVFDPLLGSLGFVDTVLPPLPAAEKNVVALIQRHIDTATYARHLLLRDKGLAARKALMVELVFLTADEYEAEKTLTANIGLALRELLRDADSLFHIGISLLAYAGGNEPFKGRMRRAFPWLLRATSEWVDSPDANLRPSAGATSEPATNESPRRLRSIRLNDYRLPGIRELELANARVHLVHGPNGSGKSSIVEALELVATGKVERLSRADATQYDAVIKNRASKGQAKIALEWTNPDGTKRADPEKVVAAGGIEAPLRKDIDASSFRLDQALMDRLIGRSPRDRARDFARAFIPEATELLDRHDRAQVDFRPALESVVALRQTLETAQAALNVHKDWHPAPTPRAVGATDFPALLNQWLEATAVLDLLQRDRAIRDTISGAQAAGWTSHDYRITEWMKSLRVDTGVTSIERSAREASAQVEDLEKKLKAFSPSPTVPGSPAAAVTPVKIEHVQALNSVSRWLFGDETINSFGMFGDKLARVINTGEAPTYGPIIIGASSWAEPPMKQLEHLIAACASIEKDSDPAPWPGQVTSTEYEKAANARRLVLDVSKRLSKQFVDTLRPKPGRHGEFDGSLIAALNELMAVFTPARWSYDDVNLPFPEEKGGSVGLNIELGADEKPARAELHLNTAELNLFTVALFLICAGRIVKPLNMLLLDDPLQNMDELTSVALARGLTKVVRLWASRGRPEQLLLLFHGQEDLERFASEVPAAKYRLPWLSPSSWSVEKPVIVKDDTFVGDFIDVQNLEGILEQRFPGAERKS